MSDCFTERQTTSNKQATTTTDDIDDADEETVKSQPTIDSND